MLRRDELPALPVIRIRPKPSTKRLSLSIQLLKRVEAGLHASRVGRSEFVDKTIALGD